MSERFVVTTVHGFVIRPEAAQGGVGNTHRPMTASFAVLDSAFCYRIVAEFNTDSNTSGGTRGNERQAHALCHELNLWADEYGAEPVPEFAP